MEKGVTVLELPYTGDEREASINIFCVQFPSAIEAAVLLNVFPK